MLAVIEREIEWPTLVFFAFLFIVVGAAVATGLIGTVAAGLAWAVREGGRVRPPPRARSLRRARHLLDGRRALRARRQHPVRRGEHPDRRGPARRSCPATRRCSGGRSRSAPASAATARWSARGRTSPRSASPSAPARAIGFREFARFGVPVTALTLVMSSAYLALYVYAGAGGARRGRRRAGAPALLRFARRRPRRRASRGVGRGAAGGTGARIRTRIGRNTELGSTLAERCCHPEHLRDEGLLSHPERSRL